MGDVRGERRETGGGRREVGGGRRARTATRATVMCGPDEDRDLYLHSQLLTDTQPGKQPTVSPFTTPN